MNLARGRSAGFAAAFAVSALIAHAAYAAKPQSQPQLPQQAEIINLNLLEALKAIGEEDMAGVFAFIPAASLPPAMADYLLHRPKALKKFVKKGEADLKAAGGITEWDQQVYVYMLNINGSGILPEKKMLSKSMLDRVQKLMIAPAMPLAQVTLRRSGN